MVSVVCGINRITGNLSTFFIQAFNISHGTFHNNILFHIPVTTINLSCLYMLLLLASVSE